MSSTRADEIRRDRSASTLGNLLFPDKTKCRPPETEWIRIDQSIGGGTSVRSIRLLKRGLGSLTDDEQRAIETAHFSELTYREAANDLNQPLGALKAKMGYGFKEAAAGLGAAIGNSMTAASDRRTQLAFS